jgi:hypothetical protein
MREDIERFIPNDEWEIETDEGWRDFKGIAEYSKKKLFQVVLDNGDYIHVSKNHGFIDAAGDVILACDSIGHRIKTVDGLCEVVDIIDIGREEKVYDFVEVERTHKYYTNGILSHNTHLIEEFWKSVFPVITSSKKSKVFVCSTANGNDNLFHTLYKGAVDGENGWAHDKIMWHEVPDRDDDWVKSTRQAIGSNDAWRQEFNCEFLSTGESSIDDDLFEEMVSKTRDPKIILDDGHYKIWEEADPSRVYVAGVDTAEGVGADSSCIQILDITDIKDIRQVACYTSNKIPPLEFATKVYSVLRNYGMPLALIERNNCGAQVVDRLANDMGYEKIVSYGNKAAHRKNIMLGMIAHTNTKYQGVLNMRYFINDVRAVQINDIETLTELKNFVRWPNGTWKARRSHHDDRVMSLLYALFILEKEITERFFEIVELDERGKPATIEQMDFGIQYFEDATSLYLDNEIVGDNNSCLPPIVFGMGADQAQDDMNELSMFGYEPLA